jgi:hypothetical protein
MNRMNWKLGMFWTFGALLCLFACKERPPLELTPAQREQIDTLYVRALNKGLKAEMDTLCIRNREAKVRYLVDSIMRARRAEEEKLRKKYLGQ